jgi:hypothetical protein
VIDQCNVQPYLFVHVACHISRCVLLPSCYHFGPKTSEGVRNVNLNSAQSELFQMLVQIVPSVWRRQVRPYTLLPWSLLSSLHSSVSPSDRENAFRDFMALAACDLEAGLSFVLHKMHINEDPRALADINSTFIQKLMLLAMSKVTNVETETNFARASSSRAYMRGKQHDSSTMCSKHICSELNHLHNLEARERHRVKFCRDNLRNLSQVTRVTPNVPAILAATQPQQGDRGNSRLNSLIIFREARLSSRPALVGESKQDRRTRIIEEASCDFKKPEFQVEKQRLQQEAVRLNKMSKNARSQPANASEVKPATSLATIFGKQEKKGLGPWGVSDEQWALSNDFLEEAAAQQGFVASSHRQWCAKHMGMVQATEILPEVTKNKLETFCVKCGGCYYKLSRRQQTSVLGVLDLCKNVLRPLRTAGPKQPAAAVVFAKEALAGGSSNDHNAAPQVFLLCQPNFSPFGACFWHCSIHAEPSAGQCNGISCPRSLRAELAWCQHGALRCPHLKSMHQLAYACRDLDMRTLKVSMIVDYEVLSLNSFRILNIEFAEGLLSIPLCLRPSTKKAGKDDSDDDEDLIASARSLLCACVPKRERKSRQKKSCRDDDEPYPKKAKVSDENVEPIKDDNNDDDNANAESEGSAGDGDDDDNYPDGDGGLGGAVPVFVEPGEDEGDPEIEISEMQLELMSNWALAVDAQGGVDDGGDNDNAENPILGNDSTYQDERGYVRETGTNRLLGRVTEVNILKRNHSLCVKCQLHKDCRLMKQVSSLRVGADARLRLWLLHGKTVPNAAQHKRDFNTFL